MAERRAVVRAAAIVVALTAGCTGYSLSPASPSCATSSQELMRSSCTVCHTAAGAARGIVPEGLDFETDAEVRRHSDIIRQAALIDMVMPPGAPLSVCDQNMLAAYLDDLASQPCTPSCDGRLCGSDACGGSCGDCPASQTCNPAGQCMTTTCIPPRTRRTCRRNRRRRQPCPRTPGYRS